MGRRRHKSDHRRDGRDGERQNTRSIGHRPAPYLYQEPPYGYLYGYPRFFSPGMVSAYPPQYSTSDPYRYWTDYPIYTGQLPQLPGPEISTVIPHGHAFRDNNPAERTGIPYGNAYGNQYQNSSTADIYGFDNDAAFRYYWNLNGNADSTFVHKPLTLGNKRTVERMGVDNFDGRNGDGGHVPGPSETARNGDVKHVKRRSETGMNGDIRHEKGLPETGSKKQTSGDRRRKLSPLKRFSNGITHGLERFFYNVGLVVGQHPKKTIAACVIIPLLLAIGLIKFKQDEDFAALLIPLSSRIPGDQKWVDDHMPYDFRGVSYIVEDDNVLSSKSIIAMMDLYKASLNIRVDGIAYTDICSGINGKCVVNSMLDLWRYNETVIRALTDEEILETVNQTLVNPTYFTEFRADKILGHISRDDNGRITGANAALILWSIISISTNEKQVGAFEKEMVELGEQGHADLKDVFILYKSSFDDEFFKAVYADVLLLVYGFPLVLIYMNLAFGKPNMVEHRFFMVFAGLAGVLLSACCCYGICLAAGLKFGVTHQALMFLLLAIGVDDAFIVMEAWKRVEKQHPKEPLEIQLALTMKHAGVSITVTSVSDAASFAVGISTIMPILSSFCVYCVVGIIALYVLQATLFPACLIIDQRRIKAKRDGFIPCYVRKNWSPNRFSNIEFLEPFFQKVFGPVVLSIAGKIIIILVTLGLAGTMAWSLATMDKGFVLESSLDESSYARKFLSANTKYYPDAGFAVAIYCDKMDYTKNIGKLELMVDRLKNSSAIIEGTTSSWIAPYKDWLQTLAANGENLTLTIDGFPADSAEFNKLLYRFTRLDSAGIAFKELVFFSDDTREITFTVFRASIDYIDKSGNALENEASMDAARVIADSTGTDAACFVYGDVFIFVEVVKYVDVELLRNFILASVCVFLVTLLLIVDIRTSFFVFICVVFVTLGLGGVFSFMNFSIDGNMVILLTFSIGLAVDFSAHVGYMFMTVKGTKNERAQKALCNIGPAVWHGAFSTFLGFVALGFAKSFSLHLFFLTFAIVIVFGLFHGLCFLPVLLSLIGPEPYDDAELDQKGVLSDFTEREEEIYSVEKPVHISRQSLQTT